MNYTEYKKGIIDQNYKNSNDYLLKREPTTLSTIYTTTVYFGNNPPPKYESSGGYRQNKIKLSPAQLSNLYVGLFVDGEGIINGTYIKKVEANYILLSSFILKEGLIKLSFKCKLTSKQRWLDWDQETWKNKIEESNSKFDFKEFKRTDSYYLRVKNHYDAECKRKRYFVYKDPPVVPVNLECGDYVNDLPIDDTLYCDQYKNYLDPEAELFCGFYQNGEPSEGPIFCSQYQNHKEIEDNLNCAGYKNSEESISTANCSDSPIIT